MAEKLKMSDILVKIKSNKNALVFAESKTLKEIRPAIVCEVGELLPQNFKSVRMGISVP